MAISAQDKTAFQDYIKANKSKIDSSKQKDLIANQKDAFNEWKATGGISNNYFTPVQKKEVPKQEPIKDNTPVQTSSSANTFNIR